MGDEVVHTVQRQEGMSRMRKRMPEDCVIDKLWVGRTSKRVSGRSDAVRPLQSCAFIARFLSGRKLVKLLAGCQVAKQLAWEFERAVESIGTR